VELLRRLGKASGRAGRRGKGELTYQAIEIWGVVGKKLCGRKETEYSLIMWGEWRRVGALELIDGRPSDRIRGQVERDSVKHWLDKSVIHRCMRSSWNAILRNLQGGG